MKGGDGAFHSGVEGPGLTSKQKSPSEGGLSVALVTDLGDCTTRLKGAEYCQVEDPSRMTGLM